MKAVRRGNDLTDTGEGGKSIYEEPFNDEFHTRLRFCGRDLIAIANAGKDDNDSQFFFTLGSTPELQNKHRIFGRVTGESIYSMFKLEEALVDESWTAEQHVKLRFYPNDRRVVWRGVAELVKARATPAPPSGRIVSSWLDLIGRWIRKIARTELASFEAIRRNVAGCCGVDRHLAQLLPATGQPNPMRLGRSAVINSPLPRA
ncbi:Peptidyl-prolyl cis-trans isomerase CWC27 like protein [Eufriesea mexicana]|uniref:Peptidyl-prolyl cis-trans isomerase n=1 Tax=Eufriesea mexicana TaxID=516756 RepID=A0A310SMM2_9HYME|nr:Peptidyl-prolyl cis-trans isomerase CWC27 like protein [Eufriesea mexicana]